MQRALMVLALTTALIACDRENAANPDVSQNSPARPGGSRSPGPPTNMTSTMNPVMPPQKDLPTKAAAGAATDQVRVELNEYDIRMPATLPAGRTSLFIVDSGKEQHSFVIEGQNFHMALPQPLTRGGTAQLDVQLQPGTYTIYCPVRGHKEHGMLRQLTVQ